MTEKPKCYLCGADCNEDMFCHGCQSYICEDCEGYDPPWGPHNPEDHEEED